MPTANRAVPEAPPPETVEAPPPTGGQLDGLVDGGSQMAQVLTMLTTQMQALSLRLDQLSHPQQPAPPQAGLGQPGPLVTAATAAGQSSDLARQVAAGLMAPPSGQAMPQLTVAQAEALVAFIPKDDPMNPRHVLFQTWINGHEYRSKRGQVMMLPRGHAIMLASTGHGYVVDVELMSGIQIPQLPNLARPDNWDGLPMAESSSVPPNFYRAA